MKRQAGDRTLLASVLLSAPGPLVLGIALFYGRSYTQLADFVRRTAELSSILVSWLIFRRMHRTGSPDPLEKARLERTATVCVSWAMILSGTVLALLAVFSGQTKTGNVIPGLVIALLGVTTNSWFWLRYRRLGRESGDPILSLQSRLYFSKSLVDACVTASLALVAFLPGSPAALAADSVGSVLVSIYLIKTGLELALSKRRIAAKDDRLKEADTP